jgi:hypothetical protein
MNLEFAVRLRWMARLRTLVFEPTCQRKGRAPRIARLAGVQTDALVDPARFPPTANSRDWVTFHRRV